MNFGLILDSALVKVSAYLARPSGQTPTHGDVIIGEAGKPDDPLKLSSIPSIKFCTDFCLVKLF